MMSERFLGILTVVQAKGRSSNLEIRLVATVALIARLLCANLVCSRRSLQVQNIKTSKSTQANDFLGPSHELATDCLEHEDGTQMLDIVAALGVFEQQTNPIRPTFTNPTHSKRPQELEM
jgi:hypothetical protein